MSMLFRCTLPFKISIPQWPWYQQILLNLGHRSIAHHGLLFILMMHVKCCVPNHSRISQRHHSSLESLEYMAPPSFSASFETGIWGRVWIALALTAISTQMSLYSTSSLCQLPALLLAASSLPEPRTWIKSSWRKFNPGKTKVMLIGRSI